MDELEKRLEKEEKRKKEIDKKTINQAKELLKTPYAQFVSAQLYRRLSDAYLETNPSASALTAELAHDQEDSLESKICIGNAALAELNLDKAKKYFESVIYLSNDEEFTKPLLNAHIGLGKYYNKINKTQNAIDEFENVIDYSYDVQKKLEAEMSNARDFKVTIVKNGNQEDIPQKELKRLQKIAFEFHTLNLLENITILKNAYSERLKLNPSKEKQDEIIYLNQTMDAIYKTLAKQINLT